MARYDRTDCLAYFRIRRAIEQHVDDAQQKDAERRQRRAQQKS